MRNQILDVKKRVAEQEDHQKGHVTIFEELVRGDLPEREKSVERLAQEGALVVSAGTETTAWGTDSNFGLKDVLTTSILVQSVIVYYVLSNPRILSTLHEELVTAIRDPNELPSCSKLERLPYLISLCLLSCVSRLQGSSLTVEHSAVVSEGLRLGYGVCQRLQRVSPNDPIYFKLNSKKDDDVMWKIPAGTPVGMTCALVHLNPDIFPEPLKFSPERWIEDRHLDRYLLSFSKGSRQCLGIK